MNSVLPEQTCLFDAAPTDGDGPSSPIRLSSLRAKPVELDFNGGALTSDAGVLLLREIEQQLGLVKTLAATIHDQRDARYVKHTVMDLLMQRIAQIACGYEDADDCDALRDDPIFKMLAERPPESGAPLSSQPTMSRFENSISRAYLYRVARVFLDNFIASYEREPEIIVVDCDDTDDLVHGDQQLALFNNYFKDYCFMPLHVYEGLSGKLITTLLKPGKRLTGNRMLAIVKRLIRYLRARWPHTIIVFRGDAHFAYPEVMGWLEEQDNVQFVIGLTRNAKLQELAALHLERAKRLYQQTQRQVTLFHAVRYQAKSWPHLCRVIIKVEVSPQGENQRFVVTSLEQAKATVVYQQIYCARGASELNIKDHKLYLKSDRTSCHRFAANQFRLFLHSAAYVLLHALKTNVLKHTHWARASVATLQLRLLKIGARVKEMKTKIKIEVASAYPLKQTLQRSFQMFELLGQT